MVLSLLSACGGGDDGALSADAAAATTDAAVRPAAEESWEHDVEHVELQIDLALRTATATITTATNEPAVSFEIGDLDIDRVYDEAGDLEHRVEGQRLDVGVPLSGGQATLRVDYAFAAHQSFDGWMPGAGVSFLWPTFCDNLFPCVSDPDDGVTFRVTVDGVAEGLEAVYPESLPAEAPSYMLALAVADFERIDLGTTRAGTEVVTWHLPGQAADASEGTAHLRDVFDFFETTYGDYLYGDVVGTVSADWGGGDFGGMEHHPFWHVSSGSLYSEEVNAHEAAHGWYGNGVRIACWEDFVLSEGVVTYMAARGLGESGVDIWPDYECGLKSVCQGSSTVVLPDETCNEIDILEHPLWSSAPYMKGAFFFRAVADEIGEDVLDAALAEFYQDHAGGAARMQELIDHIAAVGSAEAVNALAESWLRSGACPIDVDTLCVGP